MMATQNPATGEEIIKISTATNVDVDVAVAKARENTDKRYNQTAPVSEEALSVIVREPVGVVGVVLPWNFPLLMLSWKIDPALSTGCSVVVKSAEQTSLTALRIAELSREAGIPRGALQVLPGDGPSVGEPLGRHMDVDMISFTGSTDTGRRFMHHAADINLKKVVLECGGKTPEVVFHDAEHLDLVAEEIVQGAFWNMGENCSAISRLIVLKDIREPLLGCIQTRLNYWKTGDPLTPAHHLRVLIDTKHCAKVKSNLSEGALSGSVMEGPYLSPTLHEDAASNTRAQKEIFDPVLSIITADSDEAAIKIANGTDNGLTASVFSANTNRALRAARELRAGTVTVNYFGEDDITTPFGWYKHSGFGGRDNGLYAHGQYCEVKTIWIDLSDANARDRFS